jgi:DNA mismatch endonuclease (patch repair protein)
MALEMTKEEASLELKLQANRRRDRTVNRLLARDGWAVVRIWEHELRKPALVARKVLKALV